MLSKILTIYSNYANLNYMIEEKVLTDLGLTNIEAKVYLACLELGSDTVLHIAKKAQVKRPTCYVTLDNLGEQGLVTKIEKKSTTLYSVEQPKIVLNKFKEKIANFEDLVPYFEAQFNKGAKPKIRYYEGKDEISSVYTNIIFPSEEIYFVSDIEKLEQVVPEVMDEWRGCREKNYSNKNKIYKELISYNKAGIEYAKKLSRKGQEIKVMSEDLPVITDSAITENKLFIVSLDNLFGVLIESEDLARTYKSLVLLAWQAAK